MLRREPFYFLRHGQTDWNAERLCQGQTDVPLNLNGIKQAHDAKTRLTGTPIATICSSPLGRARQTAEIINEALKCRLVIIDNLQEIYFAEAEGKPLVSHAYDVLLRSAEIHGGESFEAFVERAIAGINQALGHPGPVLIVSHGGVFRAVQSHIRLDRESDITNGVPVWLQPLSGEDLHWRMIAV